MTCPACDGTGIDKIRLAAGPWHRRGIACPSCAPEGEVAAFIVRARLCRSHAGPNLVTDMDMLTYRALGAMRRLIGLACDAIHYGDNEMALRHLADAETIANLRPTDVFG